MSTRTALYANFGLMVVTVTYSLLLYPSLPDRFPFHLAAWVMPGSIALTTLLMVGGPPISPRGFRVDAFPPSSNSVLTVVSRMLAYNHFFVLQAALHPGRDLSRPLIPGIFFFFALAGNMLGKLRRNFWLGIRSPWTLASDAVWISTHWFGAKVYFVAGIAGATAVILGAPIIDCVIGLIIAGFIPVVYSYVTLRRGV
jgi:uncharacterized membrane protein